MSDDDAQAQAEYERARLEFEDLPSIERRLTEITGWPWYHNDDHSVISWTARAVDRGPVMILGLGVLDDGKTRTLVLPDGIDAQFIADAPQFIADLIDLVRHYEARWRHARESFTAGGEAVTND
jgi:hypothetical protein